MKAKVSKIKTMENIEACDCRWPVGDPRQSGFHFCGAKAVLGRPYCEQHLSMAFDNIKNRPTAQQQRVLATPIRRAA